MVKSNKYIIYLDVYKYLDWLIMQVGKPNSKKKKTKFGVKMGWIINNITPFYAILMSSTGTNFLSRLNSKNCICITK